MAGSRSNDYNPWGWDQVPAEPSKPGLYEKKKLSKRMSEKFEKTKTVASNSAKKMKDGVKEGASASADWMKNKYHSFKDSRGK